MTLLVLGTSYRSAPMHVLDSVALDSSGIARLRTDISERGEIHGVTVLSTCNRLEVIADVDSFHGGLAELGSALVAETGQDWADIAQHMYVHFDEDAQEHLFLLAAGLDSMALGESQILGQIRTGFNDSRASGTLSPVLERALSQSLELGKRAHSETELDSISKSLLDSALEVSAGHLEDLSGLSALVVGAGAMSGLTVATLVRRGLARLTVLNRTVDKAQRLVASGLAEAAKQGTELSAQARALTEDSLLEEIAAADLIISVTGARGIVISTDTVVKAMAQAESPRKKFFIDLAMPADIDPAIEDIPYVSLVGLEHLSKSFADRNAEASSHVVSTLAEVRAMVRSALEAESAHRAAKKISPTVTALRRKADTIVRQEFDRVKNKLGPSVTEDVLAEIKKTLNRTVDKLLHEPTVKVKQLAVNEKGIDYAAALSTLFDLSNTPEPQPGQQTAAGMGVTANAQTHYVQTDGHTPVSDHTLEVIEPANFNGTTVKLGTRRSQLARSQSIGIAQQLAAQTGWRVEIVEVVTEGDVNMAPLASMGGSGVFVSAVRNALLTGKIDLAVHSLKDLPVAPAAGIELAAVPPRVDPSDVLIARDNLKLMELPQGAKVGTGSPRRAVQLKAVRPDLQISDIRGNVDTRIKHVTEGRLDAVVLAAAGVRRLGRLGEVTDILPSADMLPAPGQGALAIECRGEEATMSPLDAKVRQALAGLHDDNTKIAVTAERAILARAEAGCSAPIGALATIDGDTVELAAVMADDSGQLYRATRTARVTDVKDIHDLGYRVAEELLDLAGHVPDTVTAGENPGSPAPGHDSRAPGNGSPAQTARANPPTADVSDTQ